MNDVKDRTFKDYLGNIGLYGIVQLLLPLTALITLPLVTKILGVGEYGILTLANTTGSFLIWFVLLSVPSALVRFIPGEKSKEVLSTAFVSSLLVNLVAGVIIILIMIPLSNILAINILNDASARIYLLIVAVGLIFTAWNITLYTYFRILEQVKRYIKYQILFAAIDLGLLAAAVLLTESLLYVLLAQLLTKVATSALLLTLFLRESGWAKPDFEVIKPYLIFCLPLIVPQITSWVITISDRYILSYFWDTKAVGVYNASYNLPQLIMIISSSIWFVFLPVVMRLWNSGDYEEVRNYFNRGMKLFLLLAIPIAFGATMLGNPALTILSTPEIGQASWKVIPFVSLSYICYAISAYGGNVFLFQKKTKYQAYFMTIAAVVNTVGNFLLIPKYGILGASIATLIAYLTLAVISTVTAWRYFTFPIPWMFITKALVASLVMSVVLWFFHPTEIWEVIISILGGAIIYSLALFLMKGFKKEEIEFAKGFLRTKGGK